MLYADDTSIVGANTHCINVLLQYIDAIERHDVKVSGSESCYILYNRSVLGLASRT